MTLRPLPASRALVRDILHYDRQMPSFAHSRELDLAEVERCRVLASPRISWSLLFIKAYGMLSAECPLLRQVYMPWPWPHFYEHPQTVATLAVSRAHAGQQRLFWARLRSPETRSLSDLQQELSRYQTGPAEVHYGRQLRMSRLPTPLRRLAWWMTFNLSGRKRATRLGTFALTTLAGQGTTIDRPPSIHTTTLTYGPLNDSGHARATITYDHRLMDGLTIAHCLKRLETLLQGPITQELAGLARRSRPLRAASPSLSGLSGQPRAKV